MEINYFIYACDISNIPICAPLRIFFLTLDLSGSLDSKGLSDPIVIILLALSHNYINFKTPGVLAPVPEIKYPLGLINVKLTPMPP
jgi:hypothetical protein